MRNKIVLKIPAIIGSALFPGFGYIYTKQWKKLIISWVLLISNAVFTFNILSGVYQLLVVGFIIGISIQVLTLIDTVYMLYNDKETIKKIIAIPLFIFMFLILILIPTNKIINLFRYRMFTLTSNNMYKELIKGEGIVIDYNYYKKRNIKREDIIVFTDSEGIWISRCMGLENENIEIINDGVLINNKTIEDKNKYLDSKLFSGVQENYPIASNYPVKKISNGYFFLLGDNRYNSQDSRFFDEIKKTQVLGKVIYIYKSERKHLIGAKL